MNFNLLSIVYVQHCHRWCIIAHNW